MKLVKNTKVLTVTLNPSLDKTAAIPHFRTGKENRAGRISCCAAGKGINVSLALKCLGVTNAKIKKAARYFHSAGAGIVAITIGSRGAVVFNGKEMVFAVPPRVIGNFAGCGDAFLAGFIFAQSRNESLAGSARMASACGAANALSATPGLIVAGRVAKFIPKIRIKNI